MKTSATNNPHMARGAVRSSYRPLGENKKVYIEQFPNSIDPFKIPLAKRFVSREPKYIPVGPNKRYSKIDKSVNIMLGMKIGDVKNIYFPEKKVREFIAKCKKLCPNGAFEVLEVGFMFGKDYVKIKCTSV